MKSILSIIWTLALAILMVVGLTSCFLQADEDAKNDEIPSNTGKYFQVRTDDIGVATELDETGNPTGRLGQWLDRDRDGVPNEFYQLVNPKVGVFGLGFDQETGMANKAKTLAMIDVIPGKTKYKLPLKPLKHWIKVGDVEKKRSGKTKDDLDTIEWTDPIDGTKESGFLTGEIKNAVWTASSTGLAKVVGNSNDDDDDTGDDDTGDDDTGDDDTGDDDTGDDDTGDDDDVERVLTCEKYTELCLKADDCLDFAEGWTQTSCENWFANNWRTTEIRKYMQCLNTCLDKSCVDFAACKDDCLAVELVDELGCDGTYGPEIVDVYILGDDGKFGVQLSNEFTVNRHNKVGIYLQYRDVEGDLEGGRIMASFNGGGFTEVSDNPLPAGLSYSTIDSNYLIGFTLANPLPTGNHIVEIYIEDACKRAGNIATIKFTVNNDGPTDVNLDEFNGKVGEVIAEFFYTAVNRFNENKGILAEPALPRDLFFDIEGVSVGLMQCYIWLVQTQVDQSEYTFREINTAILATTTSTNGTKYDPLDDMQASIFNFDEAMTPGVLLIWGDKGWNLFYQGPYGGSDANFIWGDFAKHEVKVRTEPYYTVSEKYKGCRDNCEYWVNFIYRQPTLDGEDPDLHTGLGTTLKDHKGKELSDQKAFELCQETSANGYWNCVIGCGKREEDDAFDRQQEAMENGDQIRCISGLDCIEECKWDDVAKTYCDIAPDRALKIKVEIPSYYLSKTKHRNRLLNENGRLKVGVYIRGAGLIPGAFETFDPYKTLYTIHLPYGDTMPNSYFTANKTADINMQAMPALVESSESDPYTGSLWGAPFNEPNDLYSTNWYWLVMYGYNWTNPQIEGWSLYSVEEPYLQDPYDFKDTRVTVTYGDIRAVDGGILK